MSNSEQVPAQAELPGMPEADPYESLVEWLESRWGRHANCPYCGINEWYVGPPMQFAHGGPQEPSLHYAPEMFTVSCRNCGNTVLIYRGAADFTPDSDSEGENEGEEGGSP